VAKAHYDIWKNTVAQLAALSQQDREPEAPRGKAALQSSAAPKEGGTGGDNGMSGALLNQRPVFVSPFVRPSPQQTEIRPQEGRVAEHFAALKHAIAPRFALAVEWTRSAGVVAWRASREAAKSPAWRQGGAFVLGILVTIFVLLMRPSQGPLVPEDNREPAPRTVVESERLSINRASPQTVATPVSESLRPAVTMREAMATPVPTSTPPPAKPRASPVTTSTPVSRRRTNLMVYQADPTPVPTPDRAAHVTRRASIEQLQRRTLAEFEYNSLEATAEPNFQAAEAALAEARLMEQRGDLPRAGIKLDEAEAAYKRAQETAKNAWK